MQTLLLNTGKTALARAIAEGSKLKVVAYRVGQAANFEPALTATNVQPVSVYQGGAETISTSLINADEVRYTVTLLEAVGPFNVGNIMLFFKSEDGPELIPYLLGVLPIAVPKYKNNAPATIGNRLVFNLTAKYTNVAEAFSIQVITPLYAILPNYRDEYDLPAAENTVYQQMILQNTSVTGAPSMVARREVDSTWFINPFFQRTDDPGFGGLRGGIAGDDYLPFYGQYVSCGFYITPQAGFDKQLNAGDAWEGLGDGDSIIDGGAYT